MEELRIVNNFDFNEYMAKSKRLSEYMIALHMTKLKNLTEFKLEFSLRQYLKEVKGMNVKTIRSLTTLDEDVRKRLIEEFNLPENEHHMLVETWDDKFYVLRNVTFTPSCSYDEEYKAEISEKFLCEQTYLSEAVQHIADTLVNHAKTVKTEMED